MTGKQHREGLTLVAKDGTVVRRLSRLAAKAIRAFQSGTADERLRKLALGNIRFAHRHNLWFACHCNRIGGEYACVAPVRSVLDNYSLRVLIKGRTPHDPDCVFVREERLPNLPEDVYFRKPRRKPDGLFEVLKTRRTGRATTRPLRRGVRQQGHRAGHWSKLSERLLRLIDDAELNAYRHDAQGQSTPAWWRALAETAQVIDIAPGRPLSDFLFTRKNQWANREVHARIRRAAKRWPKNHMPQCFLCWVERDVDAAGIGPEHSESRVDVLSRVTRRTIFGQPVSGPYLFLGAVGLPKGEWGYGCLEAHAQPIVSAYEPVPVDSHNERRAFLSLKYTLKRMAAEYPGGCYEIKKPLFEIETRLGPCLPDFLVRASGGRKDLQWVIEVMGLRSEEYYRSKARTHPRMERLGPVLTMDTDKFAPVKQGLGPEGGKIRKRILQDLREQWG